MRDEDLAQADLSHLSVNDMTPEQRAELRRRYAAFVSQVAKTPSPPPRRPGKVAKWVPGRKPG